MAGPCFCRLQVVSSNTARIPPRFTYLGYECTDGHVTAVDSLLTYASGTLPVAPAGTPMPNVGDACSCEDGFCSPFDLVIEAPEAAAPRRAAASLEPAPTTPCDEHIPVNLNVLGQWNARTSVFPDKLLRLVLLGRRERCCRLRIIMMAYLYDNQCLPDCEHCFLDECDISVTAAPGGARNIFIGTDGKKVGPFILTADRFTAPAPKLEAKPSR
jgi:hypothetical protein